AALRKALDTVVQRHEALRTVFITIDGEPRQEIRDERCFELETVDLSDQAKGETQACVQTQRAEEALRKFDLGTGPLIRGRLLLLFHHDHVLFLTLHHTVSAAWSFGILALELGELYAAYRGGRGSPLQSLPIQYGDYAQWQRGWLRGG